MGALRTQKMSCRNDSSARESVFHAPHAPSVAKRQPVELNGPLDACAAMLLPRQGDDFSHIIFRYKIR